MNQTDLRAELLEKAREAIKGMILCQDSQVEYMASFALPYAERAAIAESKLAAAQQRVKELEGLCDQTRMHKANLHKMYDELHDKAVKAGIIKSAIKE